MSFICGRFVSISKAYIMFKKTNKEPQLDAFTSVTNMLESSASKQYSDQSHWHNQFREQVSLRVDESIFSVLFDSKIGAPNAPIRLLISMMILKESFGWSDSQLFEHCRFNLLVRSSLGLFNMNDSLPVESTYYLLRQRIHDYQLKSGVDLIEKTFAIITTGQIKEFDVNGSSIRMDSKIIGSNIALYSRYEIIHHTLCMFFNSLDKSAKKRLQSTDLEQLEKLNKEESNKTLYRSTKDEIKVRLHPIGIMIYKMLNIYDELTTAQFCLLERVFNEQYKVSEDNKIELRPKEEISSSSIQSPHDPDSAYRKKGIKKVQGYSVNVTETSSEEGLNLITNVIVGKANVSDVTFVEPAIDATEAVTGQSVETVYADGAYQSPKNEEFCKDIDMVFTGIQGAIPHYDLEKIADELFVTNIQTGERVKADLVKRHKNSREDRWRIKKDKGYQYFSQQAIRAANMRHERLERPIEELRKRNNVEATIFQLSFTLRNNKSKYRGLVKQKIWTFCRCLWINLVRILNFTKQICQRTFKTMGKTVLDSFLSCQLDLEFMVQPNIKRKLYFISLLPNTNISFIFQ